MKSRKSPISPGDGSRNSAARTTRSRILQGALLVFLTSALVALAGTPANLQEALAAQRALVAEHPGDASLLNDLGNLLALAGDLEEAEETYRRALQSEPMDVTSLYNLALVLREQGENKQARKTLESILEIDPRHSWTHYQLGDLYEDERNRKKAVYHYAQAFAADRSLTSPQVNPHIVENRLATDALLAMYVQESPSTQAPRIYKEPGDVAELLLPQPVPEPEVLEAAPEAEDVPLRRRYGATYPSVPPEDSEDGAPTEKEASSPRTLDSSTLRSRSQSQSGYRADSGDDLGSSTSGTKYDNPPSFSQSPSGGGTPQPPTSPTRRALPPDSPSSSSSSDRVVAPGGFTPGLQSTGRLDLEWLPLEQAEPASSPT